MTVPLLCAPARSGASGPTGELTAGGGDHSGPRGRGPRVLVVFASRHGATREIAAELARHLPCTGAGRRCGLSTVLAPVQQQPDPAGFDALVVGSAVYDGRWLPSARRYVAAATEGWGSRPTWLFSSGLGSELGAAPTPTDLDDAVGTRRGADLVVRGHRAFAGRLERRLLSATECASLGRHHLAEGDFRDWREVRRWSAAIAAEVAQARRWRVGAGSTA
ncbi:flavodoxin domain-containing protein [Geodermatophilus chilensis]|jgi:menaquinone-dependent protoporphyrinogen oxidase|uniref:flavodoxin domain-containing protein n=1 Tax=Geodermatophilus chilensis TaxID=2035835 RepID=UPI000C25F9CF|nr:flavodoxin domain-containing protein [Geodermatophilus chilensis]